MSEKKKIEKKNWKSSFNLIGKPVINDFTYKLDERSEKSAWVYNALNLGIYCGEKYGSILAEMMGGYSENGENKIFCHGKDDDGNDDYKTDLVPEIVGSNYEDLKIKVNEYLDNLMSIINVPYCECPHCQGWGLIKEEDLKNEEI